MIESKFSLIMRRWSWSGQLKHSTIQNPRAVEKIGKGLEKGLGLEKRVKGFWEKGWVREDDLHVEHQDRLVLL
jgi:hypothetical protein